MSVSKGEQVGDSALGAYSAAPAHPLVLPNPHPAQPVPLFQADAGMGALLTQAFMAAIAAREQYRDPWMIVDHACRLRAYDFEGSINGGVADESLKKLAKAFLILGLTEVEKVQNVHGFLKGLANDWLFRVHHLYVKG